MFNGHLDTSFAASEDPEILKAISSVYRFSPPWGYIKDDWIYGMGAFNMKSALAAYAAAVRTLQDNSINLKGDIVIAGVVGEIEKTQVDQLQGRSVSEGTVTEPHILSLMGELPMWLSWVNPLVSG